MPFHWIRIFILKVVTTFYRRVIVYSRSTADLPSHMNVSFPIDISALRESDLPSYQRFRPRQPLSTIRKRIDGGDCCFLVWSEGQIVHCGWVATQRKYDPYLRCTLVLQPEDIFLYDHYTRPGHRGRGLSRARELYILPHYHQQGYRRSIALVAIENKPAFRPFEALGYLPIGMFTSVWWIIGQKNWGKRWCQEALPGIAPRNNKGR